MMRGVSLAAGKRARSAFTCCCAVRLPCVATAMAAALLWLALAFVSAAAFPVSAWADENVVDTQQLPDSSFIYDSTIDELAAADPYIDNQIVQVVGEVIGDDISAAADGGHRWITLASASGATVSAYMTQEDAARIDTFGRYGYVGTSLQVRGTFHLACPQHDGLSDLHAENVTVMKPGSHAPDQFDWNEFAPGIVLTAVGLLLVVLYSYLRERQR